MAHSRMMKLYSFVLPFDGERYAGQVPARSFDEAASLVPKGTEWGELVEEQAANLCAICAGTISKDLTQPEAINEEWPEEVG